MSEHDDILSLTVVFAMISLMMFGGVNTVLPEMHRQAVEVYGWLGNERFTELFAISQAAPGPNLMVITLIGWEVAGFTGALVATLAFLVPTCLLTYAVTRTWTHFREARWRKAIQAGMIPVTVGLVSAGALVITLTVAGGNWHLIAVTLATVLVVVFTRIHPLIPLAVAGALGYLGFL